MTRHNDPIIAGMKGELLRLAEENEYLRAENTALKAMNDSLLAHSATLQENRITRRHATHPIT